jgi:hypothetical protein
MGHEHLTRAVVELLQMRKTSSGTDHVLQLAPKACDGVPEAAVDFTGLLLTFCLLIMAYLLHIVAYKLSTPFREALQKRPLAWVAASHLRGRQALL